MRDEQLRLSSELVFQQSETNGLQKRLKEEQRLTRVLMEMYLSIPSGWRSAQPERACEGEGADPAKEPARVDRHGGLGSDSAVAQSGHGVPVHDQDH
jgi:hypothetical protein